jgi:hypothetical protein
LAQLQDLKFFSNLVKSIMGAVQYWRDLNASQVHHNGIEKGRKRGETDNRNESQYPCPRNLKSQSSTHPSTNYKRHRELGLCRHISIISFLSKPYLWLGTWIESASEIA